MTSTTKKRDYQWMLDMLPALALGQFCSKWLLTVFHGNPEASGWVTAISLALGGGTGFVLSKFMRTKITENMNNRRTVFIVSFSVSLGLAMAIITTTVLLTKSREISYEEAIAATPIEQNSVVPDATNSSLQQTKALAAQGNHIAQINLGVKYKFGLGVTQDYQEALKWFHLSAAQGNIFAPAYLGDMYAQGQGVPRDYAQSMMWYLIVKAYGSTSPDRNFILDQNLQTLESKSTTAQIAEAQRMAREWWAARHRAN